MDDTTTCASVRGVAHQVMVSLCDVLLGDYTLQYYITFWSLSISVLYLISRSSPSIKKFLIHAAAIGEVFEHMFTMLTETSLSVLAINGIQMVFDVINSWIDTYLSTGFQEDSGVPSMTFAELNDLLYYEELRMKRTISARRATWTQ